MKVPMWFWVLGYAEGMFIGTWAQAEHAAAWSLGLESRIVFLAPVALLGLLLVVIAWTRAPPEVRV
jgi:hypothetical protein